MSRSAGGLGLRSAAVSVMSRLKQPDTVREIWIVLCEKNLLVP